MQNAMITFLTGSQNLPAAAKYSVHCVLMRSLLRTRVHDVIVVTALPLLHFYGRTTLRDHVAG